MNKTKQTKIENKRKTGTLWEQQAVTYLQKSGYTIVEMNYRCRIGEIDIIAWEHNTLVFVEVKYRANGKCGRAVEAVTPVKQQTIRRVATHYLVCVLHREDIPCRFDVLGFDGEVPTLLKNAF